MKRSVDISLINQYIAQNVAFHTKSYVLSNDSFVSEGAHTAVPVPTGHRVTGGYPQRVKLRDEMSTGLYSKVENNRRRNKYLTCIRRLPPYLSSNN